MARRLLAGIAFLLVLLGVGVGMHLYLAQRLVLAPDWPAPLRVAGLVSLAAGFGAVVVQAFVRRRLRAPWSLFAWAAYSWLGIAFLLVMATLSSDAALGLIGAALPSGSAATGVARGRALLVVAVAAAAAVVAIRGALAPPRLRRIEIALPRWPRALDGFRIAQISDVHIGPLLDRRFAAHVAARVNEIGADLVAVTGDLVDGSVARVGDEVAPFAALRARHGVFFVTGNHDYYSGADGWVARAAELGWRPLRNERVEIRADGAAFDLAGVDDRHGNLVDPGRGEDLARALEGRDAGRALVLLAHDPTTFKDASRRGVDLQLSGHTHGGQLWPFRWFVRAAIPWVEGLHRVGASALYVSRGTGFWGPPMRLGAPAEITEITLRGGTPAPQASR
jgi:predicted MPP superfamily phosphohydrolase